MKAVKRQTRASGNDGESNDSHDRKKVKLGSNTDSPKKNGDNIEDIVEETSSNGQEQLCIPQAEQLVAKMSQPKTSTPITHNGSVKNIAEKFHNTSAIPSDTETQSSPAMEIDKEEVVFQEQKEEVLNGGHTNGQFVENVPEVKSTNNTEENKNGNASAEELNGTEVVNVVSEMTASTESCSSKCDVDFFLSSLLQVNELNGHADIVTAVATDQDILISASQDTTIKMWDPHKKKELRNFQGHTDSVNAVLLLPAVQSAKLTEKLGFSDTGRIVISGSTDCSIRLWSVSGGTELLSIYTYNGITCLGYMENQNCIVVGTDGGKLELWDLYTSKSLYSVVAHEASVTDLKVDDAYIYTTSTDGKVKVWLLEEDELLAIYSRSRKVPQPEGEMVPAKWNCVTSHDNLMYLGDNTSDIKLLNWKAGRLRMLRNQTQQYGSIDAICSKNDILLSSSFDTNETSGAINVWQLPSMTYICTMSGDIDNISSIDFTTTKDGILRVVSGGSKLLVWDYISSKPAAPGEDDKYFCREVEKLGEEITIKSPDKPITSKSRIERKDEDVTDAVSGPRSKCTLI